MDNIVLGSTGIVTTAIGLGSGGHSRLGQSTSISFESSVLVVEHALNEGIRLIDTSEAYGDSELIIGQGLRKAQVDRDEITIATKVVTRKNDSFVSEQEFYHSFETSCKRLETDHVDIYFLHAVMPEHYDENISRYMPLLTKLKESGRISSIGITEMFGQDPHHNMLTKAVPSRLFDMIMIGYNILNQTGRNLLEQTEKLGIGVLTMFAVRKALTSFEHLMPAITGMAERGEIDGEEIDLDSPLKFLVENGVASSLAEAGYRFCRHEPGTGCILSGTGSIDHLNENIKSINSPPLPNDVVVRLKQMFRRQTIETGN